MVNSQWSKANSQKSKVKSQKSKVKGQQSTVIPHPHCFTRISLFMKKFAFAAILLAFAAGLAAFCFPKNTPPPVEVKWYTWQQAQELQKTAPKKIFRNAAPIT